MKQGIDGATSTNNACLKLWHYGSGVLGYEHHGLWLDCVTNFENLPKL